ncbi:uncharacterized protein At4g02000-like [Ziziphus jujuba]|uniref:Uncharacterized protein At4g02000-like n=1 Tax=Ziziphus jujuba TaxID=326968 RepID=A0A6P4AIH1_ZIZJJ|nr:uncharacterized protein At4g02000-like [Ziziphus jujuba]
MADKERVIDGAPWHFERALVLTEEISGSITPHSTNIHTAYFWIHVHNVPLQSMTKSTGEAIGSHLGECVMVNSDEEGLCFGKFMRVRIKLDIRRPLRTGMKVDLGDKHQFWVEFQYEKLFDFCFQCGLLGHTQKDCFSVADAQATAADVDNVTAMVFSDMHDVDVQLSMDLPPTNPVDPSLKEKLKSIPCSTDSCSLAGPLVQPKCSGIKRGRRSNVKTNPLSKRFKVSSYKEGDVPSSQVVGSVDQPHHEP